MSNWFNAHTHSNFSVLDGMASVPDIVAKVARLGQPAVSLTDHGTMAGAVQLYTSAKKYGVAPFIGVEAYLLDPQASLEDKTPKRYHVGLLALNLDGYRGLLGLVNTSHTRPRFSRYPRITLEDLTDLSEVAANDVAVMTGCYFGLVQQTLVTEGPQQAENMVKMYASLFPNTYVEIQNHSICHDHDNESHPATDDDLVAAMVNMANRIGLPVLATQDSHYLDQGDKAAHALMKRSVYGGAEDEFPGDAFHVPSDEWVAEHYDDRTWALAEEGADHLLGLNTLSIPALDTFQVHVPQVVRRPDRYITRLCLDALADYDPARRKRTKYEERLQYELSIINDLGMANYFALVRNYVEWCSEQGICIEARGSANGSLVCFLLGITQVDPIRWKLLFDRFLSRDRVKPPDIDMDVEDTARGRLMEYLQNTFDTLQIGNWSQLGINEEGKGSVLQTYKTYLARQVDAAAKAKEITADEAKRRRAAIYGGITTMDDIAQRYSHDYDGLRRLGKMDVYRSYGVHASGLLLSGAQQRIDDYVPRMLVASSDTHVSQFDQESVEHLGYLKLDVLGQITLTVMRTCQELIGRENPADLTWIPENDSAACKLLREGRTDTGIFHYSAPAKSRGGRDMGIRSTKDAILGTALFMPGAMNSGQTELYLSRRRDREARDRVRYIHPVFEAALKETYGAVVYQEQVINIMRGLGMSIEGVNTFFKIVKSSGAGAVEANNERIAPLRAEFDQLCREAGIADSDIGTAWASTAGFVAYGFSKSHATGYGLRAYRSAYLKAHYPLEYMTALLQAWAGRDKEVLYVREARRMGIRVLPPDVNDSGVSWTLGSNPRRKTIRRGLISIKGVGMAAAESITQNAPYADIADLIERTDSRAVTGGKAWAKEQTLNGVLGKLQEAGALDSLLGE